MNTSNPEKIEVAASDWFTLSQSGKMSGDETESLEQWLASDARHQQAYDRYEQIWRELETLAGTEQGRAVHQSVYNENVGRRMVSAFLVQLDTIRSGFWPAKAGFAFACVLAVAVTVILFREPADVQIAHYQTQTGEINRWVLDDGSRVMLGAKSRLDAWVTQNERHVRLLKGEAYFEVVADADKPFFVTVNNTQVRVVGTQFNVNQGLDRVSVAVHEGKVRVSSLSESDDINAAPHSVTLVAGQQLSRKADGQFSEVTPITSAQLGSWREGRLVYKSAPLSNVVADANRYLDSKIIMGDDTLSNMLVTISLNTDRVNALPQMLSATLPIMAHYDSNDTIILMPANMYQH